MTLPGRLLAAALISLLLAAPVRGQAPLSLSDNARISLITILPGDPVYTAFGHSGLRVQDPEKDIDWMFSYGTFDFADPLFIVKFSYGRLTYWLDLHAFTSAMRLYRHERRPVIEQELNLSAEQRQALFEFLQNNARPENRYYQYDFLFDNCSTRIRDALETALGDSLQFTGAPDPNDSFRHLLDPYVANRPGLDLGFDLALGQPTDRTASPREAMFLPRYLMLAFDEARLLSPTGSRSLVARTDTLYWVPERTFTPAAVLPWPLLLAWGLFIAGLTDALWRLYNRRLGADVTDAILFGGAGVAGLVMAFLWFGSEHVVTNRNWNLLWAWPTHAAVAWLLARGRRHSLLGPYFAVTAVAALIAAAAWPFWPQDLHAAVLPFILLLGVRSGWRALLYPGPANTIPLAPAKEKP